MKTTTFAATAGRIAGLGYAHARNIAAQINWVEVGAIVVYGIKVLIALTILAGQQTRKAWDALPGLSEQFGKRFATFVAPIETPAGITANIQPEINPLATLAEELQYLTVKELQALVGTKRKMRKAELVNLALAL